VKEKCCYQESGLGSRDQNLVLVLELEWRMPRLGREEHWLVLLALHLLLKALALLGEGYFLSVPGLWTPG